MQNASAQMLDAGASSLRHAKASGDQQCTEFVAVQRDSMGLVVRLRPADVGSLRARYRPCAGAQAE